MQKILSKVGTALAMAAMAAIIAVLLLWRGSDVTSGNLVIISPHQEGIQVEFERAFSDWHERNHGKPVTIDWIDLGGTTKDEYYVRSSFQEHPEGGDFDIFFGGGTDPYLAFAELGITHPYKLPEAQLSKLPKDIGGIPLYDPAFHWYGTSLTSFGILYNKAVLKRMGLPYPRTWEDLADPKFFGVVSLADPRYSGSIRMMFEIILQGYGWQRGFDLIIRTAANCPIIVHNSSQAVREVTLGEAACGPAIDFYAWAEIAEGGPDNMGFVMPTGVTLMNPDSIAILKGAPHLDLAERFVTFVLSEEGQRLWALPVGSPGGPQKYALRRMAVLPSVYEIHKESAITANPFAMNTVMTYDREKGGLRKDIINDLIGAVAIDTHAELKRAYKAIINRGMPEAYLGPLSRLPLSEEEALELAKEKWKDAGFRAAKIAEWIEQSRRRFQDIVNDLS